MLKLLLNITDLLKRLGFLSIFLLPCVALVICSVALYVLCLGISVIIESISINVFSIRHKNKVIDALAEKIKRGVK